MTKFSKLSLIFQEKMATRIDHCEGNVAGELEGLENKRMEVAKEYAGKLEDR